MKLFILSIVFCYVFKAQGAPRISRTPCLDRLSLVRAEMLISNNIVDTPRYVPKCESDGIAWERAQCSHEGEGFCFCVDPETGAPLEDTISFEESRETINCAEPTEAPTQEFSLCRQRQQSYRQIPNVAGITAEYYPSCAEDNSFMALQRNSMTFFCVDTTSGDIIPGTDFSRSGSPLLLQENVCQAYSDIWHEYLVWLGSSSEGLVAIMEGGEHPRWTSFLQENANEILRSFWRLAEGEPTEATDEHRSVEETEVENNSNGILTPEETENYETEHQEEELEWEEPANEEPENEEPENEEPENEEPPNEEPVNEEPETSMTPIAPVTEESTVNNDNEEYDYYNYKYEPYSYNEDGDFDQQNEENVYEEESHQIPTEESSHTEEYHNDNWDQEGESQHYQRSEVESTVDQALNRALSGTNAEHFDWEEFLRLLNAEEPENQEVRSELSPERSNSEHQHSEGGNRYLSGDTAENNSQVRHNNYEQSEAAAFEDSRTNLNLKKSSK